MREDILEIMEKAYPKGFVVYWLDSTGQVRQTGHNMNKSKYLTAFHHLGMALACMIDNGEWSE